MSDYWQGLINYKQKKTMKKQVMTPLGMMENHSTHPNAMITYTFSNFKEAIDKQLQSKLGCSTLDLPDYPYADDWFECAEELAFVAPEDAERRNQLFDSHVAYTVEDIISENLADAGRIVEL